MVPSPDNSHYVRTPGLLLADGSSFPLHPDRTTPGACHPPPTTQNSFLRLRECSVPFYSPVVPIPPLKRNDSLGKTMEDASNVIDPAQPNPALTHQIRLFFAKKGWNHPPKFTPTDRRGHTHTHTHTRIFFAARTEIVISTGEQNQSKPKQSKAKHKTCTKNTQILCRYPCFGNTQLRRLTSRKAPDMGAFRVEPFSLNLSLTARKTSNSIPNTSRRRNASVCLPCRPPRYKPQHEKHSSNTTKSSARVRGSLSACPVVPPPPISHSQPSTTDKTCLCQAFSAGACHLFPKPKPLTSLPPPPPFVSRHKSTKTAGIHPGTASITPNSPRHPRMP